MRLFLGIEYVVPEPGNQTIVVGATMATFEVPPLSTYYSVSVAVEENDSPAQINTRIIDTITDAFQLEHNIEIHPSDKFSVFGNFFR